MTQYIDEPLVTIFIPTYNREKSLLRTLQMLSLQILPEFEIVVLDNASLVHAESYCIEQDSHLAQLVDIGQLRFIRHSHNIGMSANFMRAYELCNTDWLWLLSDDDDVKPDCISRILQNILDVGNTLEVALIKFNSIGCERPSDKRYVTSIEELIDILALSNVHFNSYIFITNALYKTAAFKPYLQTGYLNLHTYVPHLMMVLDVMYFAKGKSVIYLSDDYVAQYVAPEVGYSYGMVAGLGVGAFKNFVYDLTAYYYNRLENVFAAHHDFKVSIDLYYQSKFRSNMFVARKLARNYYILIRESRSVLHRFFYLLFNFLMRFPWLFEACVWCFRKRSALIDRHIRAMFVRYQK